MTSPLYAIAAVLIGACLALQPATNAAMARTLGSPLLAASLSIALSLVLVLTLWLAAARGDGDLGQMRELPWWVVIGGIAGVVFVAGGIIVAPPLGVAAFFVCVVAGQLLGATLVDHFGAFGMEVRPIGAMRVIGIGLVLAGAALVQSTTP